MSVPINVTRSGDLLDFGQLFKATIDLPKSPTFLGKFRKGVKIYHFLVNSFLGNLYRHLAIFIWSHWSPGHSNLFIKLIKLTFRHKLLCSSNHLAKPGSLVYWLSEETGFPNVLSLNPSKRYYKDIFTLHGCAYCISCLKKTENK